MANPDERQARALERIATSLTNVEKAIRAVNLNLVEVGRIFSSWLQQLPDLEDTVDSDQLTLDEKDVENGAAFWEKNATPYVGPNERVVNDVGQAGTILRVNSGEGKYYVELDAEGEGCYWYDAGDLHVLPPERDVDGP